LSRGVFGVRRRCFLRRKIALVSALIKVVAAGWQLTEALQALEIDEVIGFLRLLKLKFGLAAPPVRLRAEVGDARDSLPQEKRHAGGDSSRGGAIHCAMAFVAPGIQRQWNEGEADGEGERENAGAQFHLLV